MAATYCDYLDYPRWSDDVKCLYKPVYRERLLPTVSILTIHAGRTM